MRGLASEASITPGVTVSEEERVAPQAPARLFTATAFHKHHSDMQAPVAALKA